VLVPHGAIILVADGGGMRLMRNAGSNVAPHLEVIDEHIFHNPATHADGSDRPGRAFESAGVARHAYAGSDTHQRREDAWAEQAYALLRKHREAPAIVIAPPHILGSMRSCYSSDFRRRLIAEIDKDLAHHAPPEVARLLSSHPDPGAG